jgi:DNA-binding NarL/FixJ family response regulator
MQASKGTTTLLHFLSTIICSIIQFSSLPGQQSRLFCEAALHIQFFKKNMTIKKLTLDQRAIVQGVVGGKYLKEIALSLGKSTIAVRVGLFRIRRRAGVTTTDELIDLAVAAGWCDIEIPPAGQE